MVTNPPPALLPFGKGEGARGGVWRQSTMTAWLPPIPFPKGEGPGVGFGGKAQ